MSSDRPFRREKLQQLRELLEYWREIELWIKRADHFHNSAVIPAINELRYAGRQVFYAAYLLQAKVNYSDTEKRHIEKRLCVAEQYLQNADHDIVDSIVGLLKKVCDGLEQEFGVAEITVHFPRYPDLAERLANAKSQIQESRHDINLRRETYKALRLNDLLYFVDCRAALQGAAVRAKVHREKIDGALAQRERELEASRLAHETTSKELELARLTNAASERWARKATWFGAIVGFLGLGWAALATDQGTVLRNVDFLFGGASEAEEVQDGVASGMKDDVEN